MFDNQPLPLSWNHDPKTRSYDKNLDLIRCKMYHVQSNLKNTTTNESIYYKFKKRSSEEARNNK
ncbi:hypothetical protein KB20921_22610 [Edwardsiella ictaluri]|nr:hypothetical protein KH20906_22400 [Edwardsiella ictaluri]BEI03000.1 hypothetical protein KB20921_22610 [Edwardsiella ictaluri]BEI06461.1 hypothetical protein KH201010_22470 [Edwardsiella ictaluri]BEI09924.1 hypothetical protein STU22726_22550 [Edwardsiella ictaluri]BEI13403.1 hypothetical protein STU22816_22560 [Edwardsiella ictaluri]